MAYINGTIKKYLKDLGARTPAPGGGSVAALSASLSANLLKMACLFTIGKERYKASQSRIKQILIELEKIQKRSVCLIDEDIRAYKSKDIQRAICVPAEIAHISFALVSLAVEILEKGNKNLSSDTIYAAFLAEGSFNAAFLYVKTNIALSQEKSDKYNKILLKLDGLSKIMRKRIKKIRG